MSQPKPQPDFGEAVQGVPSEQSRAALFQSRPSKEKTMVEETAPYPQLTPHGLGEETVNMQIYNARLDQERRASKVRTKHQTQTIETRTRIYQYGVLVSDTVDREVRHIQNKHQATNAFNRNADQVWFEHKKSINCFPNYGY